MLNYTTTVMILVKHKQQKIWEYTQVTMLFLQFIGRFTVISNGKT